MNSKLSKQSAVALIKSAMKAGFSRKVTALSVSSDRRAFAVQVSLSAHTLFSRAHIIVSFRLRSERSRFSSVRSRSSVSVSTSTDFHESARDAFSAFYAVRYTTEARERALSYIDQTLILS